MRDEMIPLAEAARRLGWSWWSTREAMLRGKLEGSLVAGRWLLSAASVEAQLREAAEVPADV